MNIYDPFNQSTSGGSVEDALISEYSQALMGMALSDDYRTRMSFGNCINCVGIAEEHVIGLLVGVFGMVLYHYQHHNYDDALKACDVVLQFSQEGQFVTIEVMAHLWTAIIHKQANISSWKASLNAAADLFTKGGRLDLAAKVRAWDCKAPFPY